MKFRSDGESSHFEMAEYIYRAGVISKLQTSKLAFYLRRVELFDQASCTLTFSIRQVQLVLRESKKFTYRNEKQHFIQN